MTKEDFQTMIKGREYNHHMFVDAYDDDSIWISMSVPSARSHLTLTKDQAKDMIAALIRVVNHIEEDTNGNS
jgi:hypothetical protein